MEAAHGGVVILRERQGRVHDGQLTSQPTSSASDSIVSYTGTHRGVPGRHIWPLVRLSTDSLRAGDLVQLQLFILRALPIVFSSILLDDLLTTLSIVFLAR
jgi:hypothetical protein